MFSLLGIKDYLFAGIMVAMVAYVGILKLEISGLEDNNLALNNQVVSFTAVVNAQKVEAEVKQVEVIKEVEVIKWKTQTKIKTIKEYVKDENQTDCSNALSFARSYF